MCKFCEIKHCSFCSKRKDILVYNKTGSTNVDSLCRRIIVFRIRAKCAQLELSQFCSHACRFAAQCNSELHAVNPRVASGRGKFTLIPGFLTTAPKLFGILRNASVTFPRYILATEPQQNFSYICYRTQILVVNKGHRRHADDTSADFP